MPMPAEGAKAPALRLPAGDGTTVDLKDLAGRPAVVFFYPRAATPGCTIEACSFRDLHAQFRKAGVSILGVSADPPAKLGRWAEKKRFPYPLLGDEGHATLEKWGVGGEKKFLGRKFLGVFRATFLVGADGRVAKAWPKVNPIGHAKEVLEAVRALPPKA